MSLITSNTEDLTEDSTKDGLKDVHHECTLAIKEICKRIDSVSDESTFLNHQQRPVSKTIGEPTSSYLTTTEPLEASNDQKCLPVPGRSFLVPQKTYSRKESLNLVTNFTDHTNAGRDGKGKPIEGNINSYYRDPKWPYLNTPGLTPDILANAGFAYTGQESKIVCRDCNASVENPTPGEYIAHLHQPHCQFRQGMQADYRHGRRSRVPRSNEGGYRMPTTSQFPQQRDVKQVTPYYSKLYEARVSKNRSAERFDPEGSGISDYSTYDRRLITYYIYDPTRPITKEKLADAGFILVQMPDYTQCFSCDMILRDWEPFDDPMEEHRKLSPKCMFVVIVDQEIATQKLLRKEAELPTAGYLEAKYKGDSSSIVPTFSGLSISKPKPLMSREEHMTAYTPYTGKSVDQYSFNATKSKSSFDDEDQYSKPVKAYSGFNSYSSTTKKLEGSSYDSGGTCFNTFEKPGKSFKEEDESILYPPQRKSDQYSSPSWESRPIAPESTATSYGASQYFSTAKYSGTSSETQRESEMKSCRICMDHDIESMFLPCGHVCCCKKCAHSVTLCPICRSRVERIMRAYLPF